MTTTFEDTILIPLPCWTLLLAVPVFFCWKHYRAHRANLQVGGEKQAETGEHVEIQSSGSSPTPRQHLKLRWTTYVFFLFTLGIIILTTIEMARLAQIGWGVGLLPFVPITTIFATVLYLMRYRLGAIYPKGKVEKGITVTILSFWLFMTIFEVVKAHTLIKLQPKFPRDDVSYRTSVQILDVSLIILFMTLVFTLMVVEMLRPWWTVQRFS